MLSLSGLLCLQAWLAANHSVEETQAEMTRLQDLADAVVNIAEPRVTFRLIQVRTAYSFVNERRSQITCVSCSQCTIRSTQPLKPILLVVLPNDKQTSLNISLYIHGATGVEAHTSMRFTDVYTASCC